MVFVGPNAIPLMCCGMGETPTQTPAKTDAATGWGTAIGSMITGVTYITSSIITGVATAKSFAQREKEFELELELQKKQWDAERQAGIDAVTAQWEQAQGGGAAAGAVSPVLVLGLLAGGLALVYKLA